MRAEDLVRIRHMLDAADAVARFVDGRTRLDLDRDELLLFAVVRAIEVIGEAGARVSPDGRAALAQVPWTPIVSMRNRLIHGYFDVDRDIVWATATVEVPLVAALLEAATQAAGD